MSLLNLFGSDSSDSIQSSRFAANLKKETYDPLLLTFNSIRTGKKKDAVSKNANKDVQSNQSATLIDVFSQKMILAKSFDSLDAAQRQTQTESSCDHIVLVPTSFEIKKDTMNAFYESKFKQFFERKTDVNNNAAANIFMNWSMFESFVNFSNLNAHKRLIKLIETSYDAAKKEVGRLTSATTKVIDFTTNNAPIRIGLEELYAIVYTTPTDPASDYLPLADVFAAGGRLQNVISQKMLTYFSNYFQVLVLHADYSVGRIPKYLPLLNSNLTSTNGATPVMNDGGAPRAAPSRNVEVMSDFLIGIMTNKRLSNRSELRSDKLKAIRDKTYLCTFKSTTEYSLNYDILLKRLYYKYPCFLTPSLNMSSDTIEKMKENVIHNGLAMGADFENLLEHAVSECNKINACNLIYAVAVASQVFILIQVEWDDQDDALRDLTNVRIGLSATVSAGLNGLIIDGKVQPTQLNPLIGAACAVAHSVLAAATHQATIAQPNSRTIRQDAINAMNQVMNSQSNFASFMYDNTTLLSAMEYSDQPPVHVNIKHADYLKTFYAAKDDAVKSEQDEFNQISDEMLYVIHGPVYFDYECIFRQDPSLIKHILGEEVPPESTTTAAKEQSQWIPRVDPLTENVHYINRNPTNPNYPKMRFDNPTIPLPRNVEPRRDYADDRQYTKIWKELYVSPEQARDEKASVQENVANASHMMTAIDGLDALFATWNGYTSAANNVTKKPDIIDAMYNWMTPGYYRYELTVTVPNQAALGEQLTNRFVQLMRPVETGTVQDYTEPNLPTAYPPPLMFITPPMRGPTNSFMLHTWIPDLSSELSPSYRAFMTGEPNGKKSLNRGAYMEHLYKMMQLIFKTVMLNAKTAGLTSASSSSAETKRICVKIMAIGYSSNERNLKMVSDDDDRKFIGDSFFYAVRDYSMFYEVNNVNVIVYYNESTQQDVRQRYNEYTGQRESVLLRMGSSTSQATTIDANLKLKIMPVDDFFTLKFPIGKLQLQEKDLLYFVNYCSTPRAFIGNCGEWPENIEDVVNDAIIGYNATSPQNLLASLADAKIEIDLLYGSREIDAKMTQITQNLTQWNDVITKPKELVSAQEKIRDKYVNYKMNGNVVAASNANNKPMNVNVSWWKGHNADADNALPRNAYLSSFDEHVLILKNLLTPFAVDNFVRLMFDTNENATNNCGPYTTDVNQTAATFENAVYAYAQAKKIMTLLSKIKPDDIQISSDNIEMVKKALAHLTVDMSWSMDAKFTTGICDGAFIPNSSVLHNPFICTQLLDINKWQYVDFDDIASREIPETKPLPPLLKKIVDLKIQESLGASVSAESSAVNSSILIVSKQPSIARLMKNVKTIFENLFQKNAPLKIDGKEMVLNNYAWPEEQLYCKMRNDTKLASFKRGGSQTAIDFAELRGLRSSSARKCIEFPLFVVQLTFTLFEGKLSDITLLDQASLTCSSDKAMMDSNLKIVWEQMMTNLKAKEQNFTIANVFKRLGFNSVNAEYDYTSYFDADPGAVGLLDATQTNGTATILIACTDVATNPILRTTNSKKLEKINEEVSDTALTENAKFYNTPPYDPSSVAVLPSINPIGPYNSIRALAKIAEYFNLVEMHGVAGIPIDPTKSTEITRKLEDLSRYVPKNITNSGARIGWNAAIQTDSTMLYVNPNVMVNGTLQDISGYLLTLKPGDKILIQIDTGNVEHGKAFIYAAGRILRRKGLRFATYMKIKLLNGIYRVMNGITLLLGVVFRALELGGKALWLIFKCILNCVKYATTVVASAGLAAMGIPLAIAWLPVTLIVAILRGLIWIKKRSIVRGITYIGRTIKKRFAGDDAGDDAGDELDQMDKVIRKMKSRDAGAGDDEDMQELDQMEGAVEELENVDASGADMSGLDDETENEAVGYTLDIWRKDSKSVGSDFIKLVKKVWGKKNKPLVKVNVDFQTSDTLTTVLDTLKRPQKKIRSIADTSTQKFEDDEVQYNSDTTDDETLAKEAFKQAFGKSQMWMITESPTRNLDKNLSNKVINIPVYNFRLRTSNLINPFGQEIPNDTKLKVEFQKFSKDA
jgi:hypothetical protein